MKKLTIVHRKRSDLQPYDDNARTHNSTQIEQIVESINEFGWTNPILIDEKNNIIAGHGRLIAAALIGIDPVPCIVLRDLTEEQRKAYAIADNKIALNSGWDATLLAAELKGLEQVGFGIGVTGFNDAEIGQLFSLGDDRANDPNAEWNGMPEYHHEDKTAFRTLPVHFKDQEAVDAFAKLVGLKITDKTRFLWYPETEIETYADKRYSAEP